MACGQELAHPTQIGKRSNHNDDFTNNHAEPNNNIGRVATRIAKATK
jgi:hypothetical protein